MNSSPRHPDHSILGRPVSIAALQDHLELEGPREPGTFYQLVEESSSLKTYFVTFRKRRKNPRRGQSPWIVVDVVVQASAHKPARTQAEEIAREELPGFVFVGVN